MKEVLVTFDEPIAGSTGELYFAQAVGGEVDNGLWEGSVEFSPAKGSDVIDSGRETTQPNRADLEYWAQGLSRVYLQGALARALSNAGDGRDLAQERLERRDLNLGGVRNVAPRAGNPKPRPVLNPFDVYARGETRLRNELSALSRDHLASIAAAYYLVPREDERAPRSSEELIAAIIDGVTRNAARRPPDVSDTRAAAEL